MRAQASSVSSIAQIAQAGSPRNLGGASIRGTNHEAADSTLRKVRAADPLGRQQGKTAENGREMSAGSIGFNPTRVGRRNPENCVNMTKAEPRDGLPLIIDGDPTQPRCRPGVHLSKGPNATTGGISARQNRRMKHDLVTTRL